MKCSQALEAMLDSGPADLSPEGSSALSYHLRSCAKCARVAATMRADVRALATVMPATPTATRSRWVPWPSIALASAAVLLVFMVTRGRQVPPIRTQLADATPVVVALPAEIADEPKSEPKVHSETVARTVASARYALPDPVPLGGPEVSDEPVSPVPASEPAFDGVSASSYGRVTVLKTSNPKIIIIWFN